MNCTHTQTYSTCIIDATFPPSGDHFTFCPIHGDLLDDPANAEIVSGMGYVSAMPPEGLELVAICHPEGEVAVQAFCEEHKDALDRLRTRLEALTLLGVN